MMPKENNEVKRLVLITELNEYSRIIIREKYLYLYERGFNVDLIKTNKKAEIRQPIIPHAATPSIKRKVALELEPFPATASPIETL